MVLRGAAVCLRRLSWLLLVSVVVGADWEQKPVNQSSQEGETVRFQCRVREATQDIIVTWNKEGQTLFVRDMPVAPNGRMSIEGQYDLVISNIQAEDGGQYACTVAGLGTAYAYLIVLLPPEQPYITTNKSNEALTEGNILIVTCESRGGNPAPNIDWFKDGQKLSGATYVPATQIDAITSSQLSVMLDRSDHRANYSCFVYNSVNENSPKSTYNLFEVQFAPHVIFGPHAPLLVREGDSAILRCLVQSFPTTDSLAWWKDGTRLSETSDIIQISRAVVANSGTYQCTATNTINGEQQERNNSTTINVLYAPRISIPEVFIANESDPLNISCVVDANPTPYSIRWEGAGSIYSSKNLAINAVISKAGNYSCTARNMIKPSGKAETDSVTTKHMVLHVQYRPGDAFIKPYSAVAVGEMLQLKCTVNGHRGYPLPSFEWRRSGRSQPFESTTDTMVINTVTLGNIGNYTCTPYNKMGRGRPHTTFVDISAPPEFLDAPDEFQTVQINRSDYWIRCSVTGRPAPRITWFKDGVEISMTSDMYHVDNSPVIPSESSSFVVVSTVTFRGDRRRQLAQNKLMISDIGNYTCRVESEAINTDKSRTMTLILLFPPQVPKEEARVATALNQVVTLNCHTSASPMPQFEWYRHGNQITRDSQFGITFTKEDSVNYKSTLLIKNATQAYMGEYTCLIKNTQGQNTQRITLTTRSIPSAPINLKFASKTWESVNLEWDAGFDGGFQQTFFVLYSSIYGEETVPEYGIRHNNIIRYNVTLLQPHTSYKFKVYGQNSLGQGDFSRELNVQTDYLPFPLVNSVPEFLSQDKQLLVTWELNTSYCIRIEISKNSGKSWEIVDPCALPSQKPIIITEDGVNKVNISICLRSRYQVCGVPVAAKIKQGVTPDISVTNVIIIGVSCATLLAILLIVLIIVICRRKKSQAQKNKNYTDTSAAANRWQQPPINGNVHANSPKRGFDNADTLVDSRNGYPPQIHSNSPRPNGNVPMDTSCDSQLEKHLYENEMNQRNANLSFQNANAPRTPVKDPQQFIDISGSDQKEFGSLNSHGNESGYSTPDPTKQKKVIYEVVV